MSINLNDLLNGLETEAGIEKVASEQSVAPAVSEELKGILEKKASEDLTAAAQAEGAAVAKQLLEKLANEIQIANNQMVAEDATKIVPQDSAGTVEDVLKGTVEEGLDRGATDDNRVDEMKDAGKGEVSGDPLPETVKSAQEDKDMANEILQKIAQIVGEQTTTPAAAVNTDAGTVSNKIQEDNAKMTAYDDQKVDPLPGAEGTINNILEAIVSKAKSDGSGAGSDDLVNGTGPTEGAAAVPVTNEIVGGDSVEKAAAVSALCGEGMDFESAVALVKQAEEELNAEAMEVEKQAAFEALVEAGADFDTAVALIKQAEEDLKKKPEVIEKSAGAVDKIIGAGKSAFNSAKMDARVAGANAKELLKGTGKPGGRMGAAKSLAKNRTVQVGAMTAGAGAAGAAMMANKRGQEKKAAFEALMAEGYDFDEAVNLVKAAEEEVYGK